MTRQCVASVVVVVVAMVVVGPMVDIAAAAAASCRPVWFFWLVGGNVVQDTRLGGKGLGDEHRMGLPIVVVVVGSVWGKTFHLFVQNDEFFDWNTVQPSVLVVVVVMFLPQFLVKKMGMHLSLHTVGRVLGQPHATNQDTGQ